LSSLLLLFSATLLPPFCPLPFRIFAISAISAIPHFRPHHSDRISAFPTFP
jgi:hypothetical protein